VNAIALLHVRVVIDSRLTDPALNAETVAAAAGLNVRGANRLLKEEGTTIDRLIVSRRLDRCRRALEDRTQSRRTVSEIAYAWGFADVSHFARRFKAAYGCSPGEYRRHLSD
jgi:AraC-like DNA-binding protein